MDPSKLIKKWADLVCAKDITALLQIYNKNYYIKPTLYNRVLYKDKTELQKYFNHFIGNNDIVKVEFSDLYTQKMENMIIDMGCYKFVTRNNKYFSANYTFFHDNDTIFAHHSSHFNEDKDKYT